MNQSKSATSQHTTVSNIKSRIEDSHKTMTPTSKVLLFICDLFGMSSALLGFITNISNVNSAILAILGICWGSVRLYFYVRKNRNAAEREELEQEIRRWEWKERIAQHEKNKT